MSKVLPVQIGIAIAFGCCVFCWWKGGKAERWGAGLIFGAFICDTLIGVVTYPNTPHLPAFIVDFVLACSLLALAIRFNSIWLGAAMLLQGLELAWYAFQSTSEGFNWRQYAHWANIQTALMLLSLVAGSVASWRRRVIIRRKALAVRSVGPHAIA